MTRYIGHKWRLPVAIFMITPSALIAALLLDGVAGDAAGALALGLPLSVTVWFMTVRLDNQTPRSK